MAKKIRYKAVYSWHDKSNKYYLRNNERTRVKIGVSNDEYEQLNKPTEIIVTIEAVP